MKDSLKLVFPDGKTKEIKLPHYGKLEIEVRNGKVAMIHTNTSEKIC